MFVSRVGYKNFRNIENLDWDFGQGFIVLVGPNGAGKTNFLEGLFFASTLKRFPESSLSQLFRSGANDFFLRVKFPAAQGEHETTAAYQKTERGYSFKLTKNKIKQSKNEYRENFPVVSFLPQDLNLLTHSPQNRRRYMDEVISPSSRQYLYDSGQYKKILFQRNALLQSDMGSDSDQMEVWDEQLAETGARIIKERRKFFDFLRLNLAETLIKISGDDYRPEIIYLTSGAEQKAEFLAKIKQVQNTERSLKRTILGPHRDDFYLKIRDQKAAGFASRGQLRSLTLALKLLQKKFIQETRKETPVLLLDDVFSELDENHQKKFLSGILDLDQVFMTTAEPRVLSELPQAQKFSVESGKITKI